VVITAAVAVCSLLAAELDAPTPVMATLAFALLASLGYVWIEVILRGHAPTLELISAAVGLVLAVPVIGGVVLQAAGIGLHRMSWSLFLVGLTLAGDVVLAFRYRNRARNDNYDYEYTLSAQMPDRLQSTPSALRSPLKPVSYPASQSGQFASAHPRKVRARRYVSPWQAAACGLALLITGGAVWLAQAGAVSQHYPGFTELWLTNHTQSTSMDNLGVRNQEGITEKYRLVLARKGQASITWEITLATGQTWQRAVKVTSQTKANLYLLPDLAQPYRYVDTGA